MALGRMAATAAVALAGAAGITAGLVPGAPARAATGSGIGFAKPVYVDGTLAGGEPFVIYSHKGNDLIYSAHEGTTHLFRDGVLAPNGMCDFVCTYRNQVVIWTSHDNGATWTVANWMGTGFTTNPLINSGFSDPSLTEDAGGTIYDTGINLVNDALFSSADGGANWPTGTVQCHEGDRPWLAGGKAGEVFLATDDQTATNGSGHLVVQSVDSGASCSSTSINDYGKTADGGSFTGDGQSAFDPTTGSLVEPAIFVHKDGTVGIGAGMLRNASQAFGSTPGAFVQSEAVKGTSLSSHWPALAIDRAGTYYLVWDTDDRAPGTTGGCGQQNAVVNTEEQLGLVSTEDESPLANSILLSYSTDHGTTWSAPVTVAHPGRRVLWPWITAGAAGAVNVVWYQYDSVTDPDCATGKVGIQSASIFNTTDAASRSITTVNASQRPIHTGGICQGGTLCVATGEDRRLGDYFTNAIDSRGCVMIASGDTLGTDPTTGGAMPTSRPIFIHQDSGPGLLGQDCGSTAPTTSATGTPAPSPSSGVAGITQHPAALPNTSPAAARTDRTMLVGLGAALLLIAQRRIRRRRTAKRLR